MKAEVVIMGMQKFLKIPVNGFAPALFLEAYRLVNHRATGITVNKGYGKNINDNYFLISLHTGFKLLPPRAYESIAEYINNNL